MANEVYTKEWAISFLVIGYISLCLMVKPEVAIFSAIIAVAVSIFFMRLQEDKKVSAKK
jgi:hypothetical protein